MMLSILVCYVIYTYNEKSFNLKIKETPPMLQHD